MCDTSCSGRAGKSLIFLLLLKLVWKFLVSVAPWQGARAFTYLSEAFPHVEEGIEHRGRGKQMLWTFEFKVADVNEQGKRKKWVGGDFWGAMLPVSRISPAHLAQLPLLLLWLLVAPAPLKPHHGPAQGWALPLLGFSKRSQNWQGCCQRWGLEHSWCFWSPLGFVLEKPWLHGNATESHAGCYRPHRLPARLLPFGSHLSCMFSKASTQPPTTLGSWAPNTF